MTGSIPPEIGNLAKLKYLDLKLNNLTGSIPPEIGNLTNLQHLDLRVNNLTGSIPPEIGNLTALATLYLNTNKLTGIPPEIGSLIKLKTLQISENNLTGTIPSEIGNLTALETLYLSYNSLTGIIPPEIGNLTKLAALFLGENNLTDPIPSEIGNITALYSLGLANNNFKGPVPPEIVNSPVLKNIYLSYNFLNYSDLEPLASKNISNSWYAPQMNDTSELQYVIVENSIKFTMDSVGGTRTYYQWFKNEEEEVKYLGSTKTNSFTIVKDENIQSYYCRTINQIVSDLHFVGIAPEGNIEVKDCWQAGALTFCLDKGKWENAGKDKIKCSDIVSINDFLYFDGTMTIDTLNLDMEAEGEFYAQNIPLPGGGTLDRYLLSSGKYNLKLLGKDGEITNFLNSTLDNTAKLFGVSLKIGSLQLIKRVDTVGININCTANIPGFVVGCDNTKTTDFALRNLEVTNMGIYLYGFDVENFGIRKLNACLNKITYNYDPKKDIIVAGAEISLPFIPSTTLGAGVKIEKGEADSIAWLIDTDLPALPIYPPSTFGIRGFEGHIASVSKPNIDIEIGGTFTDILAPDLYKLKLKGNVIWPKKWILSGEGELLKPPKTDLPYQLKGNIKGAYDVPNHVLKINYNGNFLTDGEIWLANGSGRYVISKNKKTKEMELEGDFNGEITLPEISRYWPFNWFNSKVFGTYMKGFKENNKIVHGILYYYVVPKTSGTAKLVKLNYIINTEKEKYESGYIRFPMDSRIDIAFGYEIKSGSKDNTITKSIDIPSNSRFGVLEIKSESQAPVSSISSPDGKTYADSSLEDDIIFSETEDKKTAFWTLLNPKPGEWQIELENPEVNDSVISHFQQKVKQFSFTMNQVDNLIELEWDETQLDSGQVINFLFDNDTIDFDGFGISSIDASLGSTSFILDEDYPNCYYYIYAQVVNDFGSTEVYADKIIHNPLASLAPPTNFNSTYLSETGEVEFTWVASPLPDITGYILSVTDEQGNDSVYAILNNNQTKISLFIEDFKSKSAKIESYNQDWKIGCPNILDLLTTSIKNDFQITEPNDKLKVYPNPTTGSCIIRYFVSEDSKCEIRIFDIQGRQIAQPLNEFKTTGFYQLDFHYSAVPNGIYIIKFVNNSQSITVKSVLSQ